LFYAGRLSPEKNIDLLLDLMLLLSVDKDRDYRLLIAGDGPKARWLEARADKLIPGKIVQLGHVDKEQLSDLYANSNVFVHPNPREPFGIAPLEAMASGLPLVAPNSGGILSYANESNAWLVEATADSFAGAIRQILANGRERGERVKNALTTVSENTSDRSADRLLDTYDHIYESFRSKRNLFTREANGAHNVLPRLVKIALFALLMYLLEFGGLDRDPAAYLSF
jgi:glycosyltransferase involved in cell wall biosynthesis